MFYDIDEKKVNARMELDKEHALPEWDSAKAMAAFDAEKMAMLSIQRDTPEAFAQAGKVKETDARGCVESYLLINLLEYFCDCSVLDDDELLQGIQGLQTGKSGRFHSGISLISDLKYLFELMQ
jgi:hypothetical protein